MESSGAKVGLGASFQLWWKEVKGLVLPVLCVGGEMGVRVCHIEGRSYSSGTHSGLSLLHWRFGAT